MEILLSLPFVADVSIEVARSYTKQLSHRSLEGMKIEKTVIAATTVSLRSQRIQYNKPSLNKASCQTYHARQVLLTVAIKNTPVSPEKYIFLPASAFFCHSLTFIPPSYDKILRSKMYKWTSGRPDIQYLAIPTEIANGTSCYREVNIPQRIQAYVSQTTLEIEIFFCCYTEFQLT